ncbi:hypothetical protein D3C85_1471850 [compost metagenome]
MVVPHHIGDQPPGITGLEHFLAGHDQAHPGAGLDLRTPGTQAVALDHTAGTATRGSPATSLDRPDAFIFALVAQARDSIQRKRLECMAHRRQHRKG